MKNAESIIQIIMILGNVHKGSVFCMLYTVKPLFNKALYNKLFLGTVEFSFINASI